MSECETTLPSRDHVKRLLERGISNKFASEMKLLNFLIPLVTLLNGKRS